MFILLMRFPQQRFVSKSVLVFLRYAFLILLFISTYLMVSASDITNYLYFSFSLSVLIRFGFCSSVSFLVSLFILFIISMEHFSVTNSIPIPYLYIIVCIKVYNYFFIFCKKLDLIFVHKAINLLWSCKFEPPVHFLCMYLGGILAITSSNGESTSPRKILPLLSFSWLSRWILWLSWIFCTFSNSLLSN